MSLPGLHERLAAMPDYSWRADPAVPPFPDDKPLIVFDGVCVLCSGFARFVAARDPEGKFRLTAAQSSLGSALYRHFGLDPINYETNLLLADGHAFGKLDAFAGIMRRIGGPWRAAAILGALPGPGGEWIYDRIAGNRYRLFGRHAQCIQPDAGWRERVIE